MKYFAKITKLLVASEIIATITGSLPFVRSRTKVFVAKALGFRPNSRVYYANDDIGLRAGMSMNIFRKPHKIPRSCCLRLENSAWED